MIAAKTFAVYIYDSESGLEQPMRCHARSYQEARHLGIEYIRSWNLQGAYITKIEACDDIESV